MRRALRHLYLACSLACILLALALPIAWVRAQSFAYWYQWHRTDESANTWNAWDLVTGKSGFFISRQEFIFERPAGYAMEYAQKLQRVNGVGRRTSDPQSNPYSGSIWNRIGFGLSIEPLHYDRNSSLRYQYSICSGHVPYWFLLFVLFSIASPGLIGLYKRRRAARRVRANQCPACGYDLRATPDRCPECGTAISRSKPDGGTLIPA